MQLSFQEAVSRVRGMSELEVFSALFMSPDTMLRKVAIYKIEYPTGWDDLLVTLSQQHLKRQG